MVTIYRNTTVEVCLVIDSYTQIAVNWLSGVTMDGIGGSWDDWQHDWNFFSERWR